MKTSRRFVASSSALLTTSPHFMQSGLHVRQHSHAYTRGNMNCLLWLMRHGADTININTLLSHFPTLTFSHDRCGVNAVDSGRHSQKTRVHARCQKCQHTGSLLHRTQHHQHFGNFAIGLLHRTRPSPCNLSSSGN